MRYDRRAHHWPRTSLTALAFSALLLSACGQDGTQSPNGDDQEIVPSGPTRSLAIIGPALVQLEAGGEAELVVGLAEEEVGVIGGEVVDFEIVGHAEGSTLSGATMSTAVTNDEGLASVKLQAGTKQTTFQVVVSSPRSNQVAFAIHVVQLQHRIAIVRTPSVRVTPSGTDATVDTGAGDRVLLRVRVTDQFARPVPDVSVNFDFQTPPEPKSAELDKSEHVLTNAGGEAQVALETGSDLQDNFTVRARTNHSASVRWSVTLSGDQSRLCEHDDDCGPGIYCRGGICQGSSACSTVEPIVECPFGYRCVNNECHASINVGCEDDDDCGPGFICVDGVCVAEDPQCETDEDCPPGFYCHGGVCIGNPDADLPNVSGGWYTAHHFDISGMMPGFTGSLARPVREINRILTGNINLPWPFSDLIANIVSQFIPPWVSTLITILDTVFTMTTDIRSRGYMAVTQTGPTFLATEVWDSFVFYYLPKCSTIPSELTPECARVDMFVEDVSSDISLGLRVYPFSGAVGEINDNRQSLMLVENRRVDLNVAGLIRWVLDELVRQFTPHRDLNSAIMAIVDCRALGRSVENMTNGLVNRAFAESACQAVLVSVLDDIVDELTGRAVGFSMLEFRGQSTIHDIRAGDYAHMLGYPEHEETKDGVWRDDTPGSWHGSRRRIR